jgi:DNA gyrase subunit A
MNNNKISTEELMEYIKGPDFATGGVVSNKDELLNIYETGQGKVRIRGKVSVDINKKNGHKNILITEIPCTMIGAIDKFMETVASLYRNKTIPDLVDIKNIKVIFIGYS